MGRLCLGDSQAHFDQTWLRFQSKVLLGMKLCRYVPNKPEGVLRNDDLLITNAAMPGAPPCAAMVGSYSPSWAGLEQPGRLKASDWPYAVSAAFMQNTLKGSASKR